MSNTPSSEPLVLAVDDEAGILRVLRLELSNQGFRVMTTTDPDEAVEIVKEHSPAIALLDVRMPDVTGYELMKRLRAVGQLAVIMVTAKDREVDKVHGLQTGADDYVVKPFSPEELGARIRAVLRRSTGANEVERIVRCDDVEVDLDRRLVRKAGNPVTLTRTEWQLLQFLASNQGKMNLSGEILAKVWGPEYRADVQYLRVWVSRLRTKLESDAANPKVITTQMGVGYKFGSDDTETAEEEPSDRIPVTA